MKRYWFIWVRWALANLLWFYVVVVWWSAVSEQEWLRAIHHLLALAAITFIVTKANRRLDRAREEYQVT